MEAHHYVYALFRADGSPFYIGLGKGRRWLRHERGTGINRRKNATVRQTLSALGDLPKVKLAEHLTIEQARAYERAFIAAIGRAPHGPLTNLTDGGEGVLGRFVSPEERERIAAKLRGRRQSPETVARRAASNSKAQKGKSRRPHTAEEIAKIGEANRRHWAEHPETHRHAGMTGKKHSDLTKRKMREAAFGRRMSDAARAKMRVAKLGRRLTAETRLKMSVAHQRRREVAANA
jgi:hypothetical protein